MTGATVKLGATSLMYACQQGKESQVQEIIKSKPGTILERERSLKTALHYCAEAGEGGTESAAALLRAAPELVSAQDQDGYTALHLAVIAGNVQLAKLLISHGAGVNTPDNEGHTSAHWATVCGELECLELILKKKGNPKKGDMHGGCPLHYAAQMCGPGSEMPADRRLGMTALRLLIEHAADPNIPDHHGRQPILWAASAGSSEAILVLTNAGANVEAADKDGLTALHCAASRGHTDCVEALISLCNAEADVIDNNGCSALFYAVTLGHADCTQTLLNHGANTNRQDRKGRTAMHCGAAKGQMETLKVVWNRGGNLWTRTARGDYPLHEAVTSGRCDLVSWLLSLRPDTVNSPNNDGRCPLHLAAIHNNVEMCKVLLDAGSLVNPVMRTGKGLLATPLDAALHKGHRGTAKYLQLHGGVPSGRLNSESAALRGPNSRNSGIQIQKPENGEINKIHGHLEHSLSNTEQKKMKLLPQNQKILQVYVEDGVMIKRIKHPQALDDDRIRRRRRKRKSRHVLEKPLKLDKEKHKRDDYEDSTDEEVDTSQSSSFVESHLKTESETELDNKEQQESNNKRKSGQKVNQDIPKSVNDINEGIQNIFDVNEGNETKRHIQEVKVDFHQPYTESEDESKSNLKDYTEENETSKALDKSSTLQSREEDMNDSEKQTKNENEESTESCVTIVEQPCELRQKRSIEDVRETATTEIDMHSELIKNDDNTADCKEEQTIISSSGEKIAEKQSNEVQDSTTVDDKNIALIENDLPDVHNIIETDNANETITKVNISEPPEESLQDNADNAIEETPEIDVKHDDVQSELYDSLEDEPQDSALPAHELDLIDSVDNQQQKVDNNNPEYQYHEIAENSLDFNENANDLKEPVDNADNTEDNKCNNSIDGRPINDLEGNLMVELNQIEENSQMISNKIIEEEIKDSDDVITDTERTEEVKTNHEEGHDSQITNESVIKNEALLETNDMVDDQQVGSEQEENLTTNDHESTKMLVGENDVLMDIQDHSNDFAEQNFEDSVEDSERNDKGLIKVLDEENNSTPEKDKKPKRKEWKRESSREMWEPYAIGPQHDDNEINRKSSNDHSPLKDLDVESLPRKEGKNGVKGVRPKSRSRIPRMCAKNQGELDDDIPISTVSVTQAVQYSVRKYHLERRIFHQLLELKRLQIRAGRSSEGVLVKRLVDDYRRAGLMLGLQQYNGVYTFRAFERYLYDQLRLLQSSERRIIPRLKSSDDLERLTSALRKTRAGQEILTTIPNNPVLCTYQTHRCHHATHAYTGIPCAAYIRRDHHSMPKPDSFLPKLVNGEKGRELAKTLRYVDPTRPLTLELSHGSEKQVITLPTEKLDKSKRYFVTFTIKTGNKKKMEGNNRHTHASSV